MLAIGGTIWGISAHADKNVKTAVNVRKNHKLPPIPQKTPNYKPIMAKAKAIADQHTYKSHLVKKGVIRALATAKIQGKNTTYDQALQLAIKDAKQENAWFAVAKDEYCMKKPDAKALDDWISKKVDTLNIKTKTQTAEGLGMTKKEMDHKFMRDLAQQHMMWETELKQKVAKKHPGAKDVTKLYWQEVDQYMSSR